MFSRPGWVLPDINSLFASAQSQVGVNTPHQNSAMASAPTVTANGGTQPSGLTNAFRVTTTPGVFKFYGGTPLLALNQWYFFPVCQATTTNSGGNVAGTGKNAQAWRARATINSAKFAIRVSAGGATTPYRLIVNGSYVDFTGDQTSDSTGADEWITYDFTSVGGKASRDIIVEGMASARFDGIYCSPGDTVTFPAQGYLASGKELRAIFLGDSITGGTGATITGDAYPNVAGELLGITDNWCSGVGGTGFWATNSGASFALGQRLSDATAYKPDIIFVAMGFNDIPLIAAATISPAQLTATASADLFMLRRACPRAPVFVIGPWDKNAPNPSVSGFTATRGAIQSAAVAVPGCFFLDPSGVSYEKFTDGTHPDTSGHATLGAWLNTAARTAIGL